MITFKEGLIQMALKGSTQILPEQIRDKMVEALLPVIDAAGKQNVIGQFCGSRNLADPREKIVAEASKDKDELLVSDLDMHMIREVRDLPPFFRDRRPESYGGLTQKR